MPDEHKTNHDDNMDSKKTNPNNNTSKGKGSSNSSDSKKSGPGLGFLGDTAAGNLPKDGRSK
jgi:hypothetical protein